MRRYRESIKDLEYLTDNAKDCIPAWIFKARIWTKMGPTKLAVNAFTHVLKNCPNSWEGYFERGCLYATLHENLSAFEDFKAALRINPTHVESMWKHVNYFQEKELWEDSVQVLNEIIKLQPNNEEAYCRRGKAYSHLTNWELALEDMTHAIILNPMKPEYYLSRGAFLRERNPKWALEDLSTSLLINDGAENVLSFFLSSTSLHETTTV